MICEQNLPWQSIPYLNIWLCFVGILGMTCVWGCAFFILFVWGGQFLSLNWLSCGRRHGRIPLATRVGLTCYLRGRRKLVFQRSMLNIFPKLGNWVDVL